MLLYAYRWCPMTRTDPGKPHMDNHHAVSRDAVEEAFARTRRFATEHGGAPQLAAPSRAQLPGRRRQGWSGQNTQGGQGAQNSNRSDVAGSPPRDPQRRGFPTGKDGRPLPRSLDMRSIAQVWMKEVTDRGWAPHLVAAYLGLHWEEIVGSHVASYSTVTQVENHSATIVCETDAWATNLRYFQPQILKNIADTFGDQIITQLRIYGPSHKSSHSFTGAGR